MVRGRRFQFSLAIALAALPLAIGGCPTNNTGNNGGTAKATGKLVQFQSANEMLQYFRDRSRPRIQQGFLRLFNTLAPLAAEDATAGGSGANADEASDGGSQSYSTTNIQETGVDESDVFKSDGDYFYIARGQSIRIVQVDNLTEVGRIDLDDSIDEMYLRGDRLLVLARQYSSNYPEGVDIMIWPPYHLESKVVVYDVSVSDRAAPAVTNTVELDGNLASSRLTNDRLILVLAIAPELPDTLPELNALSLESVLPKVRRGEAVDDMVDWSNCYHPENPDGYFMTAAVTLDADDLSSQLGSSAIMANAGTIYASTDALYVTDAEYDADDNYRESLAIHKFAFDDNGVAQYAASGAVPGRLLNQFSLGESDGYLRVATYIDAIAIAVDVAAPGFGGASVSVASNGSAGESSPGKEGDNATAQSIMPDEPSNAVYVLGQNGESLEAIGSITDIAPNERLYSARFLGDRGFLVTFRQIDPLFALDLSDPTNPFVAGELKIPGYSDYLHPYGDNLLIGVGRSTKGTPWGGTVPDAVQLSLFDVSDLANPTVIEQLEIGGSGSTSDVSYSHKAFAFVPDSGLLAFPVTQYDDIDPNDPNTWQYSFYNVPFHGVTAFHVTADGFDPIGSVKSVQGNRGDYYDESYYYGGWTRPALVGDRIYAVTPEGVRGAPIADLTDESAVRLTGSN